VALIEAEKPGVWIDLVGGRLIEDRPDTGARTTAFGGRLTWALERRMNDRDGAIHEFFRQRYVPARREAVGGPRVPRGGFAVRGGSLGFHRDSTGRLFGIAGALFEDIKFILKPSIVSARSALESAVRGASTRNPEVASLESLDEETVKELISGTRVELASAGDGETFGFVWTTDVMTARGGRLVVTLDAASGKVLDLWDGVMYSTCAPETDTHVAVGAWSQRPGVYYPDLPATEAPGLDGEWPGFTREAHRRGAPEIIVYLGEDSDQCLEPGGQNYRVFPLQSLDGGETWYDDWVVPWRDNPVRGRSAADAMKHTVLTMNTLAHYGWSSYDGRGGIARIAVDSNCGGMRDNALFDVDGGATDSPRDGVGICRRSNSDFPEYSVALDIVAHEWGHGVIQHSAGWNGNERIGGQLHEGFADLIGYGVEWYSWPQQFNWTIGEHSGAISRRADVDDGINSYHQCDSTTFFSGEKHAVGNMVGIVFRMMAEGVANPGDPRDCVENHCDDPGSPEGVCAQDVFLVEPLALGMDHAFDFLFRLLVSYAGETTAWSDLPHLATLVGRGTPPRKVGTAPKVKVAAGSGVIQCIDYPDYPGASSAHDAFRAIGYPPTVDLLGPCGEGR